jgi:hypothetical protein
LLAIRAELNRAHAERVKPARCLPGESQAG